MACFADINVSQGNIATYAQCGGIFNIYLTSGMPRSSVGKVFGHQMAQVPEVQVQIHVKTKLSGKFQELPEMRQL